MKGRLRAATAAILCSLTLARAFANALTVIYDSGDTLPLAPFFDVFGDSDPELSERRPAPSLGAADLAQVLPIHSSTLTPGPVEPRRTNHPYTAPMFLMGSDVQSRRWLLAHREPLKRMGAVGLLVEVPDAATLRELAELAEGLSLLPASGDALAAALGLTHYPVLITADRIEQ